MAKTRPFLLLLLLLLLFGSGNEASLFLTLLGFVMSGVVISGFTASVNSSQVAMNISP